MWNAKGTGLADVVEKYCKKGDRLYVEGRIEYRQWQDKENQTRYTTEINVRDLLMLGSGRVADGAPISIRTPQAPRRALSALRQQERQGSNDTNFEDFPAALEDQDDDLPF